MTDRPRSFGGLAVALVTPFRDDGSFDRDRFCRHVEFQIAGGVDALVPCGTTGESATMDPSEQREVIAATVEVAARAGTRAGNDAGTGAGDGGESGRSGVRVIAGAGANSTRAAAKLAAAAREAGADAVLSVGPYYNKPTQEGYYRHFREVAEAAAVPVILYNVPGRTGSNITPETVLRLAEVQNIIGIKEASGDLAQVMTILRERPEGFLVLSGDDELTLPILALGGDGVISVVSNEVPDGMAQLVRAALAADMTTARRLHERLLPLMRANFLASNPIPVKTALEIMGRMDAHFRLPLTPLPEGSEREAVASALREAGAIS